MSGADILFVAGAVVAVLVLALGARSPREAPKPASREVVRHADGTVESAP